MSFPDMVFVIALYALGVNSAGFLAFAWDKHRARNGLWRVSEKTLLTLAALGGTVGMMAGQRVLRHKTRKEPFRTYLLAIAAIQVIGLVALSFPEVRALFWVVLQEGFG